MARIWYPFPARRSPEGTGVPATTIPTEWEQEAMVRTKEGVRRWLSRAASILALGLCFAELGCTSTGGLKSVWPDRPALLSFWDRRQQPPPDPANDYYARYMHAARDRSQSTTGDDPDAPAARAGESGPPQPAELLASDEPRMSPAPRRPGRSAAASGGAGGDEEIQITLGMPEPLASPSNPPEALLASTRSQAGWGEDRDGEPVPARPERRRGPRPTGRCAHRSHPGGISPCA